MSISRVVFENIDLLSAGMENVRFAFVIRYPHRFFIGKLIQLEIDYEGRQFDVYARNQKTIALDEVIPDKSWHEIPIPPELATVFVIVVKTPELTEQSLRGCLHPLQFDPPNVPYGNDYWGVFNIYRNFIMTLKDSIQSKIHGILEGIYAPNSDDFQTQLVGVTVVACPKDFRLQPDDYDDIIEHTVSLQDGLEGFLRINSSDIRKRYSDVSLSAEQIEKLRRTFQLYQRFIHYEYAHQAEAELASLDYPAALIAAIVALESVHAAFVHQALHSVFPAEYDEKRKRSLTNGLLREQGIMTLIQITPFLFLSPGLQPSLELMDKCKEGIEMRNAIMHGKSTGGQPTMRRFSPTKYRTATHSVLNVYRLFAQALEESVRYEDA